MSEGLPLSGDVLKNYINDEQETRKPLISGILYENSFLMITADTGIGKSTLIAQIISQASCGEPLFGHFTCPRPLNIYYLMFERDRLEIKERMKPMSDHIGINYHNIVIDDKFTKRLNVGESAKELCEHIRKFMENPDIIIIDPIYACVKGKLRDEDVATDLAHASNYIQKYFHCSNILIHHTHRTKYDKSGHIISEEDPFFGSVFLKAHVTGGYLVSRTATGTLWKNTKDSHNNLFSKIPLIYDQESYISKLDPDDKDFPKIDRIHSFVRDSYRTKKSFTLTEIMAKTGAGRTYTLDILSVHPLASAIKCHKSPGKSNLYEVLEEF